MIDYVEKETDDVTCTFIYVASTREELVDREVLSQLAKKNPRIRCIFSVTKANPTEDIRSGRITDSLLKETLGQSLLQVCYVLFVFVGSYLLVILFHLWSYTNDQRYSINTFWSWNTRVFTSL
jgi:hypothetical protein